MHRGHKHALWMDLDKKTIHEVEWSVVYDAISRIKAYFHAVGLRFVERADVIRMIMYAILLREHILMIGPTGAGKTSLIKTIMRGIKGAKLFKYTMSKSTKETKIFGGIDPKKYMETGQQWHVTEGYFPEAHFARFGEFYHARDDLLQTLHDGLNEREFINGPQQIKMPLITAFADTNFAPEDMPGRQDNLAAVGDRFLFRTDIMYAKDRISDYHMIKSSLLGVDREPLPPLSLQDIVMVSGVIIGMNLVQDEYVLEAYVDLVRMFSDRRVKQGRPEISSRRKTWVAQIMEVPALLARRHEVNFEDLRVAGMGLVRVPEDVDIFETVLDEVTGRWIAASKRHEIHQEIGLLEQVTERIPATLELSTLTTPELEKLLGDMQTLRGEIATFQPVSVEAYDKHGEMLSQVERIIKEIEIDFIDKLVVRLPKNVLDADEAELVPMMRLAQIISGKLNKLHPSSDEATLRCVAGRDEVIRVIGEINTAFVSATGDINNEGQGVV